MSQQVLETANWTWRGLWGHRTVLLPPSMLATALDACDHVNQLLGVFAKFFSSVGVDPFQLQSNEYNHTKQEPLASQECVCNDSK